MSHDFLNSFVVACSALVVLLLGYFARQWAGSLQTSIADLSASIKKLSDSFSTMEKVMIGFERDLDDHAAALTELYKRRCANPGCAFYTTNEEPLKLFQRRREDYHG